MKSVDKCTVLIMDFFIYCKRHLFVRSQTLADRCDPSRLQLSLVCGWIAPGALTALKIELYCNLFWLKLWNKKTGGEKTTGSLIGCLLN